MEGWTAGRLGIDIGLSEFRPLLEPSPLLDVDVFIDPFVASQVRDGQLVLVQMSGEAVPVVVTNPLPGVLRLRFGAGPHSEHGLVDGGVATSALEAHPDSGEVRISGEGISAVISSTGGMRVGSWVSMRPDGPFGRELAGPGRLVRNGEPAGWLLTARLAPEAAVYGGGACFQGPNLRGRHRWLRNADTMGIAQSDLTYNNVPFFWSDAGWGLFFNSGAPMRADLGSTLESTAAFAVEDQHLDVFVIVGDPVTILGCYTAVTGLPASVPDWALGVWTSRCSYRSETEIHAVLDQFEAADCPVDVVHVDLWQSGRPAADGVAHHWAIDRDRFPTGWGGRLFQRGVRLCLWQNPFVRETLPGGAHQVQSGYVATTAEGGLAHDNKGRLLFDFTNDAAVGWWKQQIERVVADEGASAIKADFGEEVLESARFSDGRSGRQLRNGYALLYQQSTFEALQAVRGKDAFLFCRAGTAGAQRFPCHWVGDTPATWEGMVGALRACLSLSLSGFAVVAHDVGGFWLRPAMERFAAAYEGTAVEDKPPENIFAADVEPELFLRWTQFGALSPVMRFHGVGRREPTAYPEPFRTYAVEACRLRARLRRYLVRTAGQAAATGRPMMRPMVLAFPDDRAARDAELQYMLGDELLVAPVLEAGGHRTFYVPDGTWTSLLGLNELIGPGWCKVSCRLDQFPVYVRAGTSVGGGVLSTE